jgi:deazaflavin-dependent oxidoreductase (nitroreductase family)
MQGDDTLVRPHTKELSMKKPPGLDAKYAKWIIRKMSHINTWLYRKTDGKIGGKFLHGAPVALLTTIGRKSGLERTTPVLYLDDGDSFVVVASQAGRENHPLWYLNLVENPEVKLRIGKEVHELTARTAEESERQRLWPKLVEMYPDFDNYQSWTERKIPVVLLEPNS